VHTEVREPHGISESPADSTDYQYCVLIAEDTRSSIGFVGYTIELLSFVSRSCLRDYQSSCSLFCTTLRPSILVSSPRLHHHVFKWLPSR